MKGKHGMKGMHGQPRKTSTGKGHGGGSRENQMRSAFNKTNSNRSRT